MNFSFNGYRYGSTNGQRPIGTVVVINAPDKAAAQKAALKHLKCYKVGGANIGKSDPRERAEWLANLYGRKVDVLDLGVSA